MLRTTNDSLAVKQGQLRSGERGAALATALMLLGLMAAIAMTVLAVVQQEARIAGSDLRRTQTCYAAAAGIEKMTSDFSELFARTSRPTTTQLNNIAAAPPAELTGEGFTFTPAQTIGEDTTTLAAMRSTQNITNGAFPRVTMPSGPFGGLTASVDPFTLTTNATANDSTFCSLQRTMNNYLIPIFQFGMFSDGDMELHPGPPFYFNGRVHANGNLYVNGNVTFLAKVTTANEFVYDVLRNGSAKSTSTSVSMTVTGVNVPITMGSMTNGPNTGCTTTGQRGCFPGSPTGTFNNSWNTTSVAAPVSGTPNQLGGQLQTRTTGAVPLKLPLQLDGNPTREIIKRRMPNDSSTLSASRYHTTAEIRILLDDENPSTTDASGIPSGQGVTLSTFDPIPLPNASPTPSPAANGGGRALWRINDNNTSYSNSYNETATSYVQQQQNGTARQADTVRGVKTGPPLMTITGVTKTSGNPIKITATAHGFSTNDQVFISGVGGATSANGGWTITKVDANNFTLNGTSSTSISSYTSGGTVYSFTAIPKSANGTAIPAGAGITGRILIQIVDANGNTYDVTQQILSMGMTEGEPNAIVVLQRPLWSAFVQGSRDASGLVNPSLNGDPAYSNSLTDILSKTHLGADGQISSLTPPAMNQTAPNIGYLTGVLDDVGQAKRSDIAPSNSLSTLLADWGTASTPGSTWNNNKDWNAIVPINVYNVREGLIDSGTTQNAVYERGITSVVEINTRNLARWMDGVYDQNLLAGTNAVSANIGCPDGYTVYVSDRRGDKVKSMVDSSGASINSSNGMVDNEDIYGPNGSLDAGEDVQNMGTLVKDTTELPDPAVLSGTSGTDLTARMKRALAVATWNNPSNYFRRAVRVFNGESLQVTGGTNKLSPTKGITIATENMVYIWGNYNTTGINGQPTNASTLNDSTQTNYYLGNQVPTSIVSDAFFPLSKTWFDSLTAIYPDDLSERLSDLLLPTVNSVTYETSVRAAIIAGNNLSALAGSPDAGNSGSGESRLNGGMHNFPRFLENWRSQRWNFVGSLIPLYHSTQALGQYNADSVIYSPPTRNWAFDSTFTDPNKLPPGTPQFQYIEPTAFRQVL